MLEHNAGVTPDEIIQNRFTAYLQAAVHRKRAGYIRLYIQQKEHEGPFPIEQYGAESEELLAIDDKDALYATLRKLNDTERKIILLHIFSEQTFGEIAQGCSMSYYTVTGIYYRAMQKMRDLLNEASF